MHIPAGANTKGIHAIMGDEIRSLWFALMLLVIAGLYAAVGQAGATGYLAAMAIFGFKPSVIRRTAAITAAYNLLISAAALLGSQTTLNRLPSGSPVWLIAVACGGGIRATLGARYLPSFTLR